MSLEELQHDYEYTREPDDGLESKVHEEIEDMLDDMTREEVRSEIKELEDDEFEEFAEAVLDRIPRS
ncbi:MAG: hypothetical protein ABEI58_02815 [Candidatus Nanohaloarchaea archaeon]